MSKCYQLQTTETDNIELSNQQEISRCRVLLQKMNNNWHRQAQVKQNTEENFNGKLIFDKTKDDFRIDLLPFNGHTEFLQAPVETQKKILSCAWLVYNHKTIDIESKIVAPACNHIIYRDVPGVDDGTSQQIASETLVDEAYHVLLVLNACRITREQRNLHSLKLPNFNIVNCMYYEQARYSINWQKILIQLATAIISEVFISDYLNLLADDTTIQPLNRMTVSTHRSDELAHSSIFKNLTKCFYSQLNQEQKEFFIDILPKPVSWFANAELDVWKVMLEQIGFPKTESVIADCTASNEINLLRIDYTGVIALAKDLGILDSQHGIDSFGREGLSTVLSS